MYAILDIETTGGKYNEEGITEIAIYRFDGQQVTDQFISLVNPEKEIQPFVVKLTGINNKMLRTAPKFYEVAKRIVEITEDCTLVAHNAQFDYRILKTEFRRLGFDYMRKTLCTVELSKKLMPEQPSHSLGKLVRSLGIPVSDRHRANGDAQATLKLFKVLLEKDRSKSIITDMVRTASTGILSPRLLDIVEQLPPETGVYYIHNDDGQVIYIGKSNNLKKRVNQRFTGHSRRSRAIQKEVRAVTYEKTGNELIASLKEYAEVLSNKPRYNKSKRKRPKRFAFQLETDDRGFYHISIHPLKRGIPSYGIFNSFFEASNHLRYITEEFELCLKLNGLSESRGSCSAYPDGFCHGACAEKELPETYNQRVMAALNRYGIGENSFVLSLKGRTVDEKAVIFVKDGKLQGYGYANLNFQVDNTRILKSILAPLPATDEAHYIIESYLRKNKSYKLVSALSE
ncbi:exonuclease domain-containing protein [Robertkochia aurantiaca]|uniref:exonuclease domain-containing protein n=1 Tax=Robertkochia aurantiaca TaxID=2873700 RepID=UPI001CCE7EA7|nr:exonuclease domain-containing protein [Robertkochia sp. 3YJGBD-33]